MGWFRGDDYSDFKNNMIDLARSKILHKQLKQTAAILKKLEKLGKYDIKENKFLFKDLENFQELFDDFSLFINELYSLNKRRTDKDILNNIRKVLEIEEKILKSINLLDGVISEIQRTDRSLGDREKDFEIAISSSIESFNKWVKEIQDDFSKSVRRDAYDSISGITVVRNAYSDEVRCVNDLRHALMGVDAAWKGVLETFTYLKDAFINLSKMCRGLQANPSAYLTFKETFERNLKFLEDDLIRFKASCLTLSASLGSFSDKIKKPREKNSVLERKLAGLNKSLTQFISEDSFWKKSA